MKASLKAWGAISAVFVAVLSGGVREAGAYDGGDGSAEDPYQINTAAQMDEIGRYSEDWASHFILTADIDLGGYTGTSFHIIGSGWDDPFTGVFDGNGHEISNFTYGPGGPDNYIGIFGMVYGPSAEIKHLRVRDPNIDVGHSWVGALVGRLIDGDVSGCYVEGGRVHSTGNYVGGLAGDSGLGGATMSNCYANTSVSGDWAVGGLVGLNEGTISYCYATGTVDGDNEVGGLVGSNDQDNGVVSNCGSSSSVEGNDDVGGLVGCNNAAAIFDSYATGSVVGHNSNVGGLVGAHNSYLGGNEATMANCYSTATVSGDAVFVGGLVGVSFYSPVTKCYSAGSVSGDADVGGLIGRRFGGTTSDCFWDTQACLPATSSDGGTGKTTAQMQTESTFTAAGWDFSTPVWAICEGQDYPRLWWSKYGSGFGTASDPYLIRSACQMQIIGADTDDWNKHFKLVDDIDLSAYSGATFNVIGNESTKFTGVFDGNGHTISNFSYQSTGVHYISLFGFIDGENTQVKNLTLVDPNVHSGTGDGAASLVSRMTNATVSDCHVANGNISGRYAVGGLVGLNEAGTISGCSFSGTVVGQGGTGGLVGSNRGTVDNSLAACSVTGDEYSTGGLSGQNQGSISNCYSTGNVWGYYWVGGLSGDSTSGSEISDCYSWSSVSADGSCIGGLVGFHFDATVSRCYSTGPVSVVGGGYAGGLVGHQIGATTVDCFWDVNSSGLGTSSGGTARTTVQMCTQSTFTSAGWDFATPVWEICDGTNYPKLAWQVPLAADFLCPDGVDMLDFSFFAEHWMEDGCEAANDYCTGTDTNADGDVDWRDLKLLCDNWLEGTLGI